MGNDKLRELAFRQWIGSSDRYQAMELVLSNKHVAQSFEQYLKAFIEGWKVCMIENLVEADDDYS